jgi:hypothetical protein
MLKYMVALVVLVGSTSTLYAQQSALSREFIVAGKKLMILLTESRVSAQTPAWLETRIHDATVDVEAIAANEREEAALSELRAYSDAVELERSSAHLQANRFKSDKELAVKGHELPELCLKEVRAVLSGSTTQNGSTCRASVEAFKTAYAQNEKKYERTD